MDNQKTVAVVGATGYSGGELTALLARHARAEIVALYSGSEGKTAAFESIHPALSGMTGPAVQPFNLDALLSSGADMVFLATPNEISADLVPQILEAGLKVIDLSGAFRLGSSGDYPRWYGFDHPSPELLGKAVYGLTEWCNGNLTNADLVANPGCYSTAILLALKPLIPAIDRERPIIIDAKSGVSGAGKKSDFAYSFAELSGNCKAYNVGHHRHEPEIRQKLNIASYTPMVFVPHLLPTVRGILATIHLEFLTPKTEEEITAAYRQAYGHKPFVRVLAAGQLPELKNVVGTPRADIGFVLLHEGRRAVVVSVIDNLLKGAASQAVQNFNKVFSFDEKEGLA